MIPLEGTTGLRRPKSGCRGRLVAFLVSLAVSGLVVSTAEQGGQGGQLADRPLVNALAHPAIGYYSRPTSDLLGEWNRRLADGSSHIVFDERVGYLKSTLEALHVPVESQMLVMSKTGIQGLHTAPDNPRAIYFNDVATVGYIRGAPLLEIAIQDPQQGVVFYTIEQKPGPHPAFDRREGCLTCHQAYTTLHVPGMLERSVYVGKDGLALGQWGSFDPDDRSPFRQRWGGWYVTGAHGAMRHMGNAIIMDGNRDAILSDRTLNRTSLDDLFDTTGYLSSTSDIAALMVFLHQGRAMNLVTRIGWEATDCGAEPDARSRQQQRPARRDPRTRRLLPVRRRATAARRNQGHVWIRRSVRQARTSRQSRPIAAAARSRASSPAVSVQLHDLLAGVRRPPGRREECDLPSHLGNPVGSGCGVEIRQAD